MNVFRLPPSSLILSFIVSIGYLSLIMYFVTGISSIDLIEAVTYSFNQKIETITNVLER